MQLNEIQARLKSKQWWSVVALGTDLKEIAFVFASWLAYSMATLLAILKVFPPSSTVLVSITLVSVTMPLVAATCRVGMEYLL